MINALSEIQSIYKNIDVNKERPIISCKSVSDAIDVLNSFCINNTYDAFYYLAAINLLNAAIKKSKEYNFTGKKRKQLNYFFIKTKVLLFIESILANKIFDNVSYYYNANEKCLYIEVMNVIFSFHHIKETDFIINNAAKNPVIVWPQIRLQLIAEDLFELSKKLLINAD